jgi:hypothetical protein
MKITRRNSVSIPTLTDLKKGWAIEPTDWDKHIKLLHNALPENIFELLTDDIPYGIILGYHPEVGYFILFENNGKLMLGWSD